MKAYVCYKSVMERIIGDQNNIGMSASLNLMSVSDLHHTHTAMLHLFLLWLISTNGVGFGFGSLGRRSVPKMGTVTIWETICTGI